MSPDHRIWLYVGYLSAILVAWINGANNAGNAIGTLVGARALSARRSLVLAAIFDLAGAVIFGEFVSATLMKGIVDVSRVTRLDLLLFGMTSALIATFIWVFIATLLKVPMSISQAIVGGVLGFGIVAMGIRAVMWRRIGEIIASWIYLPFLSISISITLYKTYHYLTVKPSRVKIAILVLLFMFLTIYTTVFLLLIKTIRIEDILYAMSISLLASTVIIAPYTILVYKTLVDRELESTRIEFSRHLLIASCMAMAFSHGANDVANSAGPLAAVIHVVETGKTPEPGTPVSPQAIIVSGIAISLGILLWGYRILETIGEKITPLTPETGFIAQFSGALTTLIVTRLGLPVSTTVAVVGAVAGVGLARGLEYVNFKLLFKIIAMWSIGFPLVTFISGIMVYFYMLLYP